MLAAVAFPPIAPLPLMVPVDEMTFVEMDVGLLITILPFAHSVPVMLEFPLMLADPPARRRCRGCAGYSETVRLPVRM